MLSSLSFYDSSPLKQSEIERLLNKKKCWKQPNLWSTLKKKCYSALIPYWSIHSFEALILLKVFIGKNLRGFWKMLNSRFFFLFSFFFFKSGFVGHFCLCLTYYCPPRHAVWYFSKVQDHGQKQKRLSSFFTHLKGAGRHRNSRLSEFTTLTRII